jgi:hypothetical protein
MEKLAAIWAFPDKDGETHPLHDVRKIARDLHADGRRGPEDRCRGSTPQTRNAAVLEGSSDKRCS